MAGKTKWLAHIADDGREQTVLEHLEGTATLCAEFAAAFGAAAIGEAIGLLHDIGKYSPEFQQRLQGEGERVDHATAGAYELWTRSVLEAQIAAFCVAGHHNGLPDGGSRSDLDKGTFFSRINKAKAGKIPGYAPWREEIAKIPDLPQDRRLLPGENDRKGDQQRRADFFTRMLYSCLVDADFLDTEKFMDANAATLRASAFPAMEELQNRLQNHITPWYPPRNPLNEKRCRILDQCRARGDEAPRGLFTLTVPTGSGKTVASLAFALHHCVRHQLKRIVYVIPYTSIIDQTAKTFRNILGDDIVLEHHSSVTFCDDDNDDLTDEKKIRHMKACENWDMPVIVTTAVQFFESIYGNRSSKTRKLHNLANSVIIFDEAQMLPLSYLRPCVSAIGQLVENYGASAVLCTATQPALTPLFQELFPTLQIAELCPPQINADPIFQRVYFETGGTYDHSTLAEELNEHRQALCIVNRRKGAQAIFAALQPEGAFHLSTLMYPRHREKVLTAIKKRLKEGLPCRVVATSLIEAGVDVDFPAVYREINGLDSILQAAGRCNREGRRDAQDSIVKIFRLPGKISPFFSTQIAAFEVVVDEFEDINSPEAIELYFREWRDLKGREAQDKNGILKKMEGSNGLFPFHTIAQHFKLIDQDTIDIFIPEGEGEKLLQRYEGGECSRALFRKMQNYTVAVYRDHLEKLIAAGAISTMGPPDAERYYLRDISPSVYHPRMGLQLDIESGNALFS